MKFLQSYFVQDPKSSEGEGDAVLRVSMNAAERQTVVSNPLAFVWKMREQGRVRELGCHCSICESDGDCCGHLFAAGTVVEPVSGGVKLVTTLRRNI